MSGRTARSDDDRSPDTLVTTLAASDTAATDLRTMSGTGRGPLLDPADRLLFERILAQLRLSFLAGPPLALLAFGPPALPFAALIGAATLGSWALVWGLLRASPVLVLRAQLLLRLLDCAIVALVLTLYHSFLGATYYDAVFLLFVVAAAATHGRLGALLLAIASGLAILASHLALATVGAVRFETRLLTDAAFYAVFFATTGLAVALLMERSAATVARREQAWRGALAARNTALARLAAQNEHLYQQAREAIRGRDELLASAAHDLKNPLVSIKTYVQLLAQDVARETATPTRVSERLARIDAAARRVQALADELADVARLELGEELLLNLGPVDLVALGKHVVDEHTARAGSCTLLFESADPALDGVYDGPRLERVLGNLVENALKYSPGGGEVRVSVWSSGAASEQAAYVQVRDHGVGIPAVDLPHVFERFRRAGNVAGRIAGSGLGLAGAKSIVEEHGGSIELVSQEGVGTTVTVRLPVGVAGRADERATEPAGAVSTQ